jgi:phosphoribosylanthranilate isomerase
LHGDEDADFCKQFLIHHVRMMKAIRVKDKTDIDNAEDYFTDAILLDAFNPDKYGGTGVTFDWNVIGNMNKRVFLAGGINPDNAEKAVKLGVYGIDICSGIESEPGKKDHDKMKKLFKNIHHLRA